MGAAAAEEKQDQVLLYSKKNEDDFKAFSYSLQVCFSSEHKKYIRQSLTTTKTTKKI